MIDINELRRLAQEATSGEWYVERGNHIYGRIEVTDGEEEWHPVIACTDDDEINVDFEANAAFIAAANPAAISELLDRLEAAEKDIIMKEEVIDSMAAVVKRLDAQCDAAETEALEQARLNGMGAERELALMAKMEAAEEERDDLRKAVVYWQDIARRLRAKIESMEKQEPVAEIVDDDFGKQIKGINHRWRLPNGAKLYALPGAKENEMTDIVERLNDSLSAGYIELRKEAAEEIMRLRAEIEAMKQAQEAKP